MKKIYLSAVLLAAITSVNAQKMERSLVEVANELNTTIIAQSTSSNIEKELGAEIYLNDFSTPADWTLDNNGQTGATFGWNIDATVDGWPNFLTPGISSTSGGNFAELGNGDPIAGTQALNVDYKMTLASALDIPNLPANTSNTAAVQLEFSQFGALFNDEQYVEVSTDGTLWTRVYNNNLQEVLSNSGGAAYPNPETITVNITNAIAGNPNNVLIRFGWTTRYPAQATNPNVWVTYGWLIDDVKILSLPLDNVEILSSYIFGTTNGGAEYGRTPLNQLDTDWTIGSQVHNLGSLDQPTTNMTADFGTFTANGSTLVESDSTRAVETTQVGLGATLTIGMHTGNYTVVAGNDTASGTSFSDNTDARTFEVTNDVYSLDGIGVYPSPSIGQVGTNSFDDASTTTIDENSAGIPFGTMYHIKTATAVSDIEVVLGSRTTVGGEIVVALIDTAVFLSGAGGTGAVTPVLTESSAYLITATDTIAGVVRIPLPTAYTLNPGAYYALASLTVYNPATEELTIADEETIGQPAWNSAFYLKESFGGNPVQTYTNGNAYAIRLVTGNLGLNENSLNGVEVYPNPTTGKFTVTNENNTENTIAIFDMLGKEVYTNTTSSSLTVDLSANGMGVYLVKVSNENGSIVKRVVIK